MAIEGITAKAGLSLYARVVSVDVLAKENPIAAQQKAMEYINEIFNSEEILNVVLIFNLS